MWILALSSVTFIQGTLWGPVNETFRAKYIFIKEEEGESRAIERARSLFIFTNVVTLLGFICFMFLHLQSANLIAPGNSDAEISQLDFMLQILAPSLFLTQATLLLSSILNAYNIFYTPEIAGFISSILNIASFILLVPFMGIYSLAVSYYLGLIVLLVMLIQQIRKQKIPLFSSLSFRLKDSMPYLIFALPFFIPYFFSQLNSISEKSLATNLGTGSISIIDYSRKFIDIPMSVIYSVLSTIMIPVLSQKFAQNEMTEFKKELRETFQLGLIFLGSFISILILGATDMINIIYNSGKIDGKSLDTISKLSVLYGFSSLAIFCFSIFGFTFISLKKNKIYATTATFAHIAIISINLIFFKELGIYIFPFSLLTAYFLNSAILIFKFHTEVGGILRSVVIYTIFIIILCLISYCSKQYIFSRIHYHPIILLILKTFFLVPIILSIMFLLRLDELKIISNSFQKLKMILAKRFL